MADQNDAEKTEQPTAKKLSDARKKGNIARSQEVNSWAALLGLLVCLVTFIPWLMSNVTLMNFVFLESPHSIEVNNESIQGLLRVTATELFLIVGPILFFFLIIGFLSTYIQVGRTFSCEKMKTEKTKCSETSKNILFVEIDGGWGNGIIS